MDANPGDLVRSGYNALSRHYRGDQDTAHEYDSWLADLRHRLPGHGQILDIGCGCGIPVARHLAAAGYQVTGVDISDVQIERARRLVPGATFIRADVTEIDFSAPGFDAVVCLYALIHMPLDRQPRLLRDIVRWLRPGGQADAATYRSWIRQAGLEITGQQFVPEGDSGHALFWARRMFATPAVRPNASADLR
jgi:2-polyprenyl-3-methyl-5-hydroxy-6-metoxy-1,4-benzoquinol methylase